MLAGQALICPRCGNLKSVCSNPAIDWHPQESYCFSTAAVQWKWRKLRGDFPAESIAPDGVHDLDGIDVWASDLDIESLTASLPQAPD